MLEKGDKQRISKGINEAQTPGQTGQTKSDLELMKLLMKEKEGRSEDKLKHAQKETEWAKEAGALKQTIARLETDIKFLPASPQEISKELQRKAIDAHKAEQKRGERKRILTELKSLGIFSSRRRKKLLKELEGLN